MRKREGIEPRHGYETVDAAVVMCTAGHSKGAHPALAPASPPGAKTVARHQGSVGNSGDPLGSSTDGRRVAHPAHREDTRHPRGRRMPPYARRGGGTPTEHREAQRGARSRATPATRRGGTTATTGSERESHMGAPGAADALYGADAPLHRGQPARLLRGARWLEGARSRWSHQGDVRAASGGQPPGAA